MKKLELKIIFIIMVVFFFLYVFVLPDLALLEYVCGLFLEGRVP